MEFLIRITGGDVLVMPRDGEARRVLYTFESLIVSKGIVHFTFIPDVDRIPEGAKLPDFISVHMLAKDRPFPTDNLTIRGLRSCYGQEPVPQPSPFLDGIPQKAIVGVDTSFLTSSTGRELDAHWESLMIFNEPEV